MGPAQPTNTPASPSASTSAKASVSTPVSGSSPHSTAMSTTPTTIKKLPTNIPKLESNGANWAIFMMRFRDVMKVTHRWAYFTGSKPRPRPKDISKPMEEEIEAAKTWEHKDSVASFLLSQCLPDTTLMRLSGCATTQDQWDMVTKEYCTKSVYAQANLHQTFLEMRCAKGVNVRDFLSTLCCKREELAAASVTVTDKEYKRTILQGIPQELAVIDLTNEDSSSDDEEL